MANKLGSGRKIESDETPEQALIRELQEEVGITVRSATLFDKLEYQFPDRHITLWFFLVESWQGEPWGKEGQPGRWMAGQTLDPEAFPRRMNRLSTNLSAWAERQATTLTR